jgi:carbon monoxide dehydrogenase subunit G
MNLSFTLHKSADLIFDYLTDMDKFTSIHPLITKIVKTGNNKFLVHETVKLGFVPCAFTYPVTIESNYAHKTVTIKATVMKMTHIEMNFSIHQNGDLSIVEETISFKSILPIKAVMEKIFREQHTVLFQNLDQL